MSDLLNEYNSTPYLFVENGLEYLTQTLKDGLVTNISLIEAKDSEEDGQPQSLRFSFRSGNCDIRFNDGQTDPTGSAGSLQLSIGDQTINVPINGLQDYYIPGLKSNTYELYIDKSTFNAESVQNYSELMGLEEEDFDSIKTYYSIGERIASKCVELEWPVQFCGIREYGEVQKLMFRTNSLLEEMTQIEVAENSVLQLLKADQANPVGFPIWNVTAVPNPQNANDLQADLRARRVFGAVYNDYAEYRKVKYKPGTCVVEVGDGSLVQSNKRLQLGANIISDTYGFAIGQNGEGTSPIAVCGRALTYVLEDRSLLIPGAAVCSGPDGTVSIMSREEIKEWPDAIVGYISEIPDYDYWGEEQVVVDGRVWIKIK